MPGAPRAASASPSDAAPPPGRRVWSKRQRLRKAAQFAIFLPASAATHVPAPAHSQTVRAARRWLAMSAFILPALPSSPSHEADAAPVRFGFAVPKRQARRAVARNTVRRVLREAARRAAPALDASAGPFRVDVLLRLKLALPPAGAATWGAVKQDLRSEVDGLLAQLEARLRANADRSALAQSPVAGFGARA